MNEQSIEWILGGPAWQGGPSVQAVALAAAVEHGPIVDRDRGIVVHRTDPDLQTELANVIAAGAAYLPDEETIMDLLVRAKAEVESAGRDAYRVATLYENDGEGPPEGGVEPTEAQPEVPSAPSPLPERTYHGMDEKAVREWASAWEMQAWTCRDYMIRDACRAKVAEWDADPDLVPVMLSREDAVWWTNRYMDWDVTTKFRRISAAARAALEANPGGES